MKILLLLLLLLDTSSRPGVYLPIKAGDRQSLKSISLTRIGEFGLLRKERPGIPSHYHTGIDIRRPGDNFENEPVFPISEGIVISVRNDGPYAQLIIEHGSTEKFWTVYEHVAGIKVQLNERVTPDSPIARFMNKDELNTYGWQFDHFHFEVLKLKPAKIEPDKLNPDRHYLSHSLTCLTQEALGKYFHHPMEFLKREFGL